jgi:hypothetical protein
VSGLTAGQLLSGSGIDTGTLDNVASVAAFRPTMGVVSVAAYVDSSQQSNDENRLKGIQQHTWIP